MKAAALLLVICALVLAMFIPSQAQAASQIAPRDGLWLSMPPDSVKCIVIRLPWDAGITEPGDYVFSVGCSPGPGESWADLSSQIVREVHENNTADIPVCFSTAGNKPVGNCSEPYTITLSERYTGVSKEWHGGICVSERGDIDIVRGAAASTGSEVRDVLNSNTDIFSAWLEEETLYAKPGEQVVFNLSVQSYARLDIVILTQSDLAVNPAQSQLSTSEESPHHYRTFSVTAPSKPGTHTITFRVGPESCTGSGMSYCTKFLEGTFVVSEDDPPEETGFGVALTPENIDVKEPREVLLTLKVKNNNAEKMTYTSSVSVDPVDGQSGFHEETVEIGPYDSRTKLFTVLPGESSLYEVTATAVSGGAKSSATSFITVDELKTDALRQAEGLDDRSVLDSWLDSHDNSDYGSDLNEYGDLKDALASAKSHQNDGQENPPQNTTPADKTPDAEPQGIGWLVLPLFMAAAGAVVIFLLLRSRDSGKQEQEYY